MSKDSLVEIPSEKFLALRDKFAVDWPKHIASFSLINNLAKRHERNSLTDQLKVFCLNGDWETDGTFVAIVSISRNVPESVLKQFLCSLTRTLISDLWIQILSGWGSHCHSSTTVKCWCSRALPTFMFPCSSSSLSKQSFRWSLTFLAQWCT